MRAKLTVCVALFGLAWPAAAGTGLDTERLWLSFLKIRTEPQFTKVGFAAGGP